MSIHTLVLIDPDKVEAAREAAQQAYTGDVFSRALYGSQEPDVPIVKWVSGLAPVYWEAYEPYVTPYNPQVVEYDIKTTSATFVLNGMNLYYKMEEEEE